MNNRLMLFIVALVVIMLAGTMLRYCVAYVLKGPVYFQLVASGALAGVLVYIFLEYCLKMLAACAALGAGLALVLFFAGLPLLECVNLALVLFVALFLMARLGLFLYEQWQLSGMTLFIKNLFR